jgi:hypothetical protein
MMFLSVNVYSSSFNYVPNFSGVSLSPVGPFIRLSRLSNGKMVYLRIEESATEVWFKVELHRVMDDTKAKENLLRRMNGPTGDRAPVLVPLPPVTDVLCASTPPCPPLSLFFYSQVLSHFHNLVQKTEEYRTEKLLKRGGMMT